MTTESAPATRPSGRPGPEAADPGGADGEKEAAEEGSAAGAAGVLGEPQVAPDESQAPPPPPPAREITDPRELRAMTHPVRLALLEVLNVHPALTATEAGELIGESPTTCSFHLRQLAKYGFVEEAGDAPGRRRPWRLAVRRIHFSSTGGDAEMSAASSALENLLVERWANRFSDWQRVRGSYPESWQSAATATDFLVYLTPEELAELHAEMLRLLDRFEQRNPDASLRPERSLPVELVIFGYPVSP